MKIDKTAKENTIKKIDQKFSSRIKKPDIIGYEIVDNSAITGVKYMKEPREPQAPTWFIAFEKKNDERWERQEAFNAKQEAFNDEVREFMVKTDKRLNVLETKVDAIMKCPTIKRELKK